MTGGREIDVKGLCAMAAVVLCGAAAILVLVILVGGSKDVESKSFAVAIAFALFTLPGAAGIYLAQRRPGLLLLGALTTFAAAAAFISVIFAIWHGIGSEGPSDWRTAGVLTLISIGTGQASLILSLGRPDDSPQVAWLRWAGLLPIAVLTVLAAEDISHSGPDTGGRTYAVLGILYVLGVVLPPLVERATRPEGEPGPPGY
jgi:hypothetical protein